MAAPLIAIEALRKSFDGHEVLKGISFSVEMGEIVALIGGNGAGKTTTLSTISGLVRPTAGTIVWKGEQIQNTAVEAIVGSGLALHDLGAGRTGDVRLPRAGRRRTGGLHVPRLRRPRAAPRSAGGGGWRLQGTPASIP